MSTRINQIYTNEDWPNRLLLYDGVILLGRFRGGNVTFACS